MDYFRINKYSAIDENILYISNNIIEILKCGDRDFGKLVEQYEKKYFPEISINIEISIYLAMMFLYGIGKIEVIDRKIKLVVKEYGT